MNKIYLALVLLVLSACSGYQPLYGQLGNEMNEIGLKEVKMKEVEKNIGARRLAQILNQKLARIFVNTFDNDYDLVVELSTSESAIATRSDDTDKRKVVRVKAEMTLYEKDTTKSVFKTTIERYSTYTTQDEPFATEAARTKAFESVVSALSGDIIQRAALWFRGYTGDENNI